MVSSRRTFLRGVGATVGLGAVSGVASARHWDSGYRRQRNARVRVVHASPDAPNVDIYVDDNLTLPNVPFGAVSDYLTVPWGEYNVKVVPVAANGDLSKAVIDADVRLFAYRDYTIAAVNEVVNIQPLVLRDRNVPGFRRRAQVRVVHLAPDAPPVDVAVENGPVIFDDVEYLDDDYEYVRPGQYTVEVRPAGASTVVDTFGLPELQGGTSYSVFAIGLLEPGQQDESFTLVPAVDSTGGSFFDRYD